MSQRIDLERERGRTEPDYVVFTPSSADGSSGDTGNEHFFVFERAGGALLAVWTQSTHEHQPDHRAVMARSDDGGVTWSAPRRISEDETVKASWVFPVVAAGGRIYAFYYVPTELSLGPDRSPRGLACRYSDDEGRTWSPQGIVRVPRTKWDSAEASKTANWLVWQQPQRLSEGKPLAGVTRGVARGILPPQPVRSWVANPSVVDMVRFENIDAAPEPEEIELRFFCSGDNALKVGMEGHPEHPVAQEPSVTPLPDGRLICVMRTVAGSPFYSLSADGGRTWSEPSRLRLRDDGEPLLHPLSPCPIYALPEGDYFLLIHNHGRWLPTEGDLHRRPLYIVRGEYRPGARQPIWFSEPRWFMDTGGVALGFGRGVDGLAMYSSVTHQNGRTVLWYPDRKFFLLGRRITRELLDNLIVDR